MTNELIEATNIISETIQNADLELNVFHTVIGVLCGLGIFILGMKFMTDGIQRVAGHKMQSLLDKLTTNRFIAANIKTSRYRFIQ